MGVGDGQKGSPPGGSVHPAPTGFLVQSAKGRGVVIQGVIQEDQKSPKSPSFRFLSFEVLETAHI